MRVIEGDPVALSLPVREYTHHHHTDNPTNAPASLRRTHVPATRPAGMTVAHVQDREPGAVFLAAMLERGGRCPFCDRPRGDTVTGHGRFSLAWCATAWKAAGAEGRWLRAHPDRPDQTS